MHQSFGNGGKFADVDFAQFLFSDDWNHEDTNYLYNSEAYLNQHLAIFKSQYVGDAVQSDGVNCPLGKYFLVPPEILECISERKSKSGSEHESQSSSNSTDQIQPKKPHLDPIIKLSAPLGSPSQECSASTSYESDPPKTLKQKHVIQSPAKIKGTDRFSLHDLESIPHIKNLPKVSGELLYVNLNSDDVDVVFNA
ncbi:uncharacterized protein LOC131946492 isoform X2 [Physella acuta]|uniref:uncharacterized protein LOC131946492 isoform X2 n=1 Tax=Physella acuta TaxID=109671 RepID=UPI0027DC5138|nr:uncharacterized protein LOC131946492 isoform X2 [Physella acuta]